MTPANGGAGVPVKNHPLRRPRGGIRLLSLAITSVCLSRGVQAESSLWRRLGPDGATSITGISLSPADPLVLYVTADAGATGEAGVWKTDDGGQTWTALGVGDPDLLRATCVAVGVLNPNNVYVGTANGIVATSHDAGATWTKASSAGKPQITDPVSAIAVQPATGSIHAAMRETEACSGVDTPVSRSMDVGATWSATNFGKRKPIFAILADPFGSAIFAGTNFVWSDDLTGMGCPGGWGGGVERTADAGANWSLSETDLGFPVTALATDRRGGIVAGTESGGILRSENSGATWVPLGTLPGAVAAVAIDAAEPSNLYAALPSFGFWRSTDAGTSWRPFDAGLGSRGVRSLAIDPAGRTLFAGTNEGVFRRDLPAAAAGACQRGDDHLCFFGSRFRVEVHAIDPASGTAASPRAAASGDRFGSFAFPTLAGGDPALPKIFVRMDDAASLPGGGQRFFASSLIDIPYNIVVTDTTDGRVRLYDGRALCGTVDALAFPANAPSSVSSSNRGRAAAPKAAGDVLALLSGRFRIAVTATDPESGAVVGGDPVRQSDGLGYFGFPALTGDPAAVPEVLVEMRDARSLENGDFSFSHSGMSALPYTLTVTDSVTGLARIYQNDRLDTREPCGSIDRRVTTAPPPAILSGVWPGSSTYFGSTTGSTTIASVRQSGDQFLLQARTEEDGAQLRFFGTLRDGVLDGVLQYEGTDYRLCHVEGAARGTATGAAIRLRAESLSGTCGDYGSFTIDLTGSRESVTLSTRRSRMELP